MKHTGLRYRILAILLSAAMIVPQMGWSVTSYAEPMDETSEALDDEEGKEANESPSSTPSSEAEDDELKASPTPSSAIMDEDEEATATPSATPEETPTEVGDEEATPTADMGEDEEIPSETPTETPLDEEEEPTETPSDMEEASPSASATVTPSATPSATPEETEENVIEEVTDYLVIEGTTVTGVTDAGKEQEEIVIPDGITVIGNSAFKNCTSLKKIVFPSNGNLETIGNEAFRGCVLLSDVTFPEGLETLGSAAFYGCSSLTAINIPKSLTKAHYNAVFEKTSIKEMTFADGILAIPTDIARKIETLESVTIPDSVKSIGDNAFYDCTGLKTVVFSDAGNLTEIKAEAFRGCTSLTDIVLPAGLESIGSSAFKGCESITKINIPASLKNAHYNAVFEGTAIQEMTFEEGLNTIPEYIAYKLTDLASVTIPDSVKAIGDDAFNSCTGLKTVIFSDAENLAEIKAEAFRGCSSLTDIVLPAGLESLGSSAFKGCESITKINIPASLKEAHYNAVFEGTSISEITFDEGITKVPESFARRISTLESVIIPNSVKTIEGSAFLDCTGLKTVTFSDANNLTKIEAEAFRGCTSLTNVVLPAGLESIGSSAFKGCEKITKINIPASLKNTHYNAIFEGTSISEITFDEGVTKVPESFARHITTLESVIIPDSVKTIEGSAFFDCTGLKTVTFSDAENLTKIEAEAFRGCTSLTNVVLPAGLESIGSSAFKGCEKITKINIPTSLKNAHYNAVFEGTAIEEMTFEDGLEYIPDYIAYKLPNIEIVTIPSSVNTIGNHAFDSCSGLKTVNFSAEGNLNAIGNMCFKDCKKLTGIVLPVGLATIGSSAFKGCESITKINIPASLVKAHYNAIFEGTSIREITFDEGVTKVPECFAKSITTLESVTIPAGVKTIEVAAFLDCTGLKTVTFFDAGNLTQIGDNAFWGCASLADVTLPAGLESIGSSAFKGCEKITKINIPASLKKAHYDAVFEGTSIREMTIEDGMENIPSYLAYKISTLETVTIPSSVKTIGSNAFSGCSSLDNVVLPDDATTIGDSAFADCAKLSSINMPKELQVVGGSAFYNCTSLAKVELPYRVHTIASNAFKNCTGLTDITVLRNVKSLSNGVWPGGQQLTVHCVKNSKAYDYAKTNNNKIEEVRVPATNVSVDKNEISFKAGDRETITLSVSPENMTDAIVFTSSNTGVATVTQDRNRDEIATITGVSPGTTYIKAQVGSVEVEIKVTVVQLVTGIRLNKVSPLSMEGGDTITLVPTVSPTNATNKTVSFESDNEECASVSDKGVITAKAKGTAVITVRATDGSNVYAQITVQVKNTVIFAETVDELACIEPGKEISAIKYKKNMDTTWIYSNPDASAIEVTFDDNTSLAPGDSIYILNSAKKQIGKYTADQLAGKQVTVAGTQIRIRLVTGDSAKEDYYGFKISKLIEPVPLKSISIAKKSGEAVSTIRIKENGTAEIKVMANPENTTVDLTKTEWKSEDDSVATVQKDESGNAKITAHQKGSVLITATVDGKTSQIRVNVVPNVSNVVLKNNGKVMTFTDGVATLNIIPGKVERISIETNVEGYIPVDEIEILDNEKGDNYVATNHLQDGYILVDALTNDALCGSFKIKIGDEIERSININGQNAISLCYADGSLLSSLSISAFGVKLTGLKEAEELLPVVTNHVFAGWYSEKNGGGKRYTSSSTYDGVKTLYAHFEEISGDSFAVAPVGDQIYTGTQIKPVVTVYDGDKELVLNTDYKVTYVNNINAASAEAVKAPEIKITGAGNYTGTQSVKFNIIKKDITDADVTVNESALTKAVSGGVQKLIPVVKWGTKTLNTRTDIELEYPDTCTGAYTTSGQYKIVIKAKEGGNYTGERTVLMTLFGKEATSVSKASVTGIANAVYTGEQILQPTLKVTVNKVVLVKDKDYRVDYRKNIDIGTAEMDIIGIGDYVGKITKTFKITGTAISKVKVISGLENSIFTNSAITPTLVIKDGENTLTENVDYVLSYSNNINVGNASVVITGKGKYTGTVKKTFKIVQAGISDTKIWDIAWSDPSLAYDSNLIVSYVKNGAKVNISLSYNGMTLREGTDYTVKYANNKAVGDATALKAPSFTITGKGKFKGSITKTFTIKKQKLENLAITAADVNYANKKGNYKATVAVKDTDGTALRANTDYVVKYYYVEADETTLGEEIPATAIVAENTLLCAVATPKNVNLNGYSVAKAYYRVINSTKNLSKATVTVNNPMYYTGNPITLTKGDITVKIKINGVLTEITDFEIVADSYTNNVNKGKAGVTIKGTGEYGGTKAIKFDILAKKTN